MDLENRTLDKGMTHPLPGTCPAFSRIKENLESMFRHLTVSGTCHWYKASNLSFGSSNLGMLEGLVTLSPMEIGEIIIKQI